MVASLKLAFLALPYFFILLVNFSGISVNAVNIGIQVLHPSARLSEHCSRTCESKYCDELLPLFLRYGKYCGLLYSGCPGEKPCDGLDDCCMRHDKCIEDKGNDYLNKECSRNLINCMNDFEKKGGHTFKGSKCDAHDVIKQIKFVMQVALLAGEATDPKPVHHSP